MSVYKKGDVVIITLKEKEKNINSGSHRLFLSENEKTNGIWTVMNGNDVIGHSNYLSITSSKAEYIKWMIVIKNYNIEICPALPNELFEV